MLCFLTKNPREASLALDTLVATYEVSLTAVRSNTVSSNETATVSSDASSESSNEQTLSLPVLQPLSEKFKEEATLKIAPNDGDVARGKLSRSHATEVFRVSCVFCWGMRDGEGNRARSAGRLFIKKAVAAVTEITRVPGRRVQGAVAGCLECFLTFLCTSCSSGRLSFSRPICLLVGPGKAYSYSGLHVQA